MKYIIEELTKKSIQELIKIKGEFTLAQILKICDELNISIESIFLPEHEGAKTREIIEAIIKYQEKLDW